MHTQQVEEAIAGLESLLAGITAATGAADVEELVRLSVAMCLFRVVHRLTSRF